MTSNQQETGVYFTDKPLHDSQSDISKLTMFRNDMYNRFKDRVIMLLESKKPVTRHTSKGLLNPRRAYRYPFSDSVFIQKSHSKSGDTTIVMLIDGSGSMDSGCQMGDTYFSKIQVCSSICSAFAKAIQDVLGNQIKVEIFLKSASGICSTEIGGSNRGDFVSLTRLFSNQNYQTQDKFDKLLTLSTRSPLLRDGRSVGSFTSEFSVLPALFEWFRTNIVTKNTILFNLTDGEAYTTLGDYRGSFGNSENKHMRLKYLKQFPNVTMYVGDKGRHTKDYRDIYGDNFIETSDSGFHHALFTTLLRFLDTSL